MKGDELLSKRLRYRKFKETDFNDLYEFLSDQEVCRYLPGPGAFSKEQIERWLQFFITSYDLDKPNMIYAVTLLNSSKVIGYAGFAYVAEFNKNEIMYAFHKDVWNQGYATESARMMLEIAKAYHQPKIIALADINNIPSQKVLLKIGYKQIKQITLWGSDLYYYEMKLK